MIIFTDTTAQPAAANRHGRHCQAPIIALEHSKWWSLLKTHRWCLSCNAWNAIRCRSALAGTGRIPQIMLTVFKTVFNTVFSDFEKTHDIFMCFSFSLHWQKYSCTQCDPHNHSNKYLDALQFTSPSGTRCALITVTVYYGHASHLRRLWLRVRLRW